MVRYKMSFVFSLLFFNLIKLTVETQYPQKMAVLVTMSTPEKELELTIFAILAIDLRESKLLSATTVCCGYHHQRNMSAPLLKVG